MARQNDTGGAVGVRELVQRQHAVNRHEIAVEDPREVAVERGRRPRGGPIRIALGRWQQQAVLQVERSGGRNRAVHDGQHGREFEQAEKVRVELHHQSQDAQLSGSPETIRADGREDGVSHPIHRRAGDFELPFRQDILDDGAAGVANGCQRSVEPVRRP